MWFRRCDQRGLRFRNAGQREQCAGATISERATSEIQAGSVAKTPGRRARPTGTRRSLGAVSAFPHAGPDGQGLGPPGDVGLRWGRAIGRGRVEASVQRDPEGDANYPLTGDAGDEGQRVRFYHFTDFQCEHGQREYNFIISLRINSPNEHGQHQ